MDPNGNQSEEQTQYLISQLESSRQEIRQLRLALNSRVRNAQIQRSRLLLTISNIDGPSRTPLELFSPEVWELLFKYLQNSSDLINCMHASPVWNNILAPQKNHFIFEQIFPLIETSLQKSDVLKCRTVCRSWRKGVDNFIQIPPDPRAHIIPGVISEENFFTFSPDRRSTSIVGNCVHRFTSIEFIRNVLEYYSNRSDCNPFISRHVKFELGLFGQPHFQHAEFWRSVQQLVEKFGKEIWYCEFVFPGIPPTLYYSRLCQLLLRLPNLKMLSVKVVNPNVPPGFAPEHLENILLPELNQLTQLHSLYLPNVILNQLLLKYNHVKSLDICTSTSDGDDFDFMQGTSLPNLVHFGTIDNNLARLRMVDWRLETLCVQHRRTNYNASGLFQFVNKFGATLRELKLCMDHVGRDDIVENKNKRLILPQLEKLHISEFGAEFNCIDFALPLTSLREFSIVHRNGFLESPYESQGSQIIQYKEHTDSMNVSNIWKLLPNLTKFLTTYAVRRSEHLYTREGNIIQTRNFMHE